MSVIHLTQDLLGKPVISIVNGHVMAWLCDILVAPTMRQIAAAVTLDNGVEDRGFRAIPSADIQVWGRDALLTGRRDFADWSDDLGQMMNWPSVSRHLRGYKVITASGKQIGTLYDLAINERGQIVGYDLSEVLINGPIADSRQLPAQAFRSLESNILVVDLAG